MAYCPIPRAGRLVIFRLAVVDEKAGMAGVVAALSVASDLTRGHPPGEAMRVLAGGGAGPAGALDERRGVRSTGTLMRFAGCAATSQEIAAVFGAMTSWSARGSAFHWHLVPALT